tara:strand:+ start:664 stop:1074 length:411 start_codon:yes stop_codon:yes gene_type:complete
MSLLDFDAEARKARRNPDAADKILRENILGLPRELPIEAEHSTWQVAESPERLVKRFKFDEFRKLFDFIGDLLVYEERMKHHAKIIIEHRAVTIETYTHDVDRVTELDKELADFCDLLYRDVQDYYTAKEVRDENI